MTEIATERRQRTEALRAEGFPRRLSQLYAVITACLIVQAGLHALTFLLEITLGDGLVGLPGAPVPLLTHVYRASFWVFALAIPLGCFFWMRWLDWSVKNRLVESGGRFGRTPAGVVWAYFIPLVNLYRPLIDLRRLYQAETRFGQEAPGVMTVWWLVTLAHLVLMLFDIRAGITPLTAASSALGFLSNALALTVILVFRSVQRRALPHGASPDEPAGDGLAPEPQGALA